MVSPRSGCWIVFNGEAYNFLDIRRELEGLGYQFVSHCDTEVILAAYDHWGKDFASRLVGMFAIAIYDPQRGRLTLVRDRAGKKPLYYFRDAHRLAFASELHSLLALKLASPSLRLGAMENYFFHGYFPGEMTPLEAFHKLPPAHLMEFDCASGRASVERYWNLLDYYAQPEWTEGEEYLTDRLEEMLLDSVRLRLISDVPLGVFLSGGIDSSLVTALMTKVSKGAVKTFTIGFSVPEMDEAPKARVMADFLHTDHHEQYVSWDTMPQEVVKVASAYDEPFADTSSIPTAILSRMTRQHVTVALCGDAGDEQFQGYKRYTKVEKFRQWRRRLGFARIPLMAALGLLPHARTRRWARMMSSRTDAEFYAGLMGYGWHGLVPHQGQELEVLAAARRVEQSLRPEDWRKLPAITDFLTYLPDDLLVKVDRASMAVALEVRAPLLDHRVVEFAARLPLHMKWRGGTSKYVLKRILGRMVPREIWDHPKKGFGIPLGTWFRHELKDWLLDELTGNWDWTCGVVSRPAVERLIRVHMAEQMEVSLPLWALMSWKLWARRVGITRP